MTRQDEYDIFSLSLGLHVTSSFPKIQNQRVSKVIILIRYERGKIYICFSKTDSMKIDALSTKLTLNPNLPLLPNIFCRHANDPLELIHSSRDSIRKAGESFLIDLARTLEPHGMNRRDES